MFLQIFFYAYNIAALYYHKISKLSAGQITFWEPGSPVPPFYWPLEIGEDKKLARDVERYEKHAKPLTSLSVGDSLQIQNQEGNYPLRWDKTGVLVERLEQVVSSRRRWRGTRYWRRRRCSLCCGRCRHRFPTSFAVSRCELLVGVGVIRPLTHLHLLAILVVLLRDHIWQLRVKLRL